MIQTFFDVSTGNHASRKNRQQIPRHNVAFLQCSLEYPPGSKSLLATIYMLQ